MGGRRRRRNEQHPPERLLGLTVIDIADKGRGLARHEGKVVFIEKAIPGDVVDVVAYDFKAAYAEGIAVRWIENSPLRVEPICKHFGVCGGCKWQHYSYAGQLASKQKLVVETLNRLGKMPLPAIAPIIGSPSTVHYRNKLEYTATHKRWIESDALPWYMYDTLGTKAERMAEKAVATPAASEPGLGFHMPGRFDKIVSIEHCHHMPEPANAIRNWVHAYCMAQSLPYYDLKAQDSGWLRNLITRNTSTGQWMVIVQVAYDAPQWMQPLLDALIQAFPQITTLQYVVNTKLNDTFHGLEVHTHTGPGYIEEQMEDLRFRIGPKSFFQTNTQQSLRLYQEVRRMAALAGTELVYDLYTGTGTIGLFLARQAKAIIGVEYVESAVEDARLNAEVNGIANATFFAGDMAKVLSRDFIAQHGRPDVVITDPPRAGMAPEVVERLLEAAPARIVYVSCNVATQARDLNLLSERYEITEVQPIDMFPHTDHVENIVALQLKPQS